MKRDKVKGNKYNIIQPLLLAVILVIGMLIGYRAAGDKQKKLISKDGGNNGFSTATLDEVFKYIDAKYLYETNFEKLEEKAINSAFSELDIYSRYISPYKIKSVTDKIEGYFVGLGVSCFMFEDTLYVLDVFENSPASKSGIESMDKILQLGNVNIAGGSKNIEQIKQIIQDYSGKDLGVLVMDRKNVKKPVTVEVKKIGSRTVNMDFLLPDSSLYVCINQFSSHTYQEFMKVIEKYVKNDSLENLIIDLRNNPGGYLQEVNKILDQFFNESKLPIVATVYKDGRKDEIKTSGRNFYEIKNISVLINENSASGSEVLAGVIQDHDRGAVVGKPSFGKGLVQEQFRLKNGGGLRLTIANYYLPTGRSIQKQMKLDSSFIDLHNSHYENKDTFYSLNKGRPLISGGGIIPDYIVRDTDFSRVDYLFWDNDSLITSWAVDYIRNNPKLFSITEKEFSDNYMVSLDTSFTNQIENVQFYNQELLNIFLKSRIAYILYGLSAEGKIVSKVDPFIQKAMEIK